MQEVAYSKSGFVRILFDGNSCYYIESKRSWGWKKLAGIYDREKAIKFMETWAG